MSVRLEYGAPAPPDDPISLFRPNGWIQFNSERGNAWVMPEHGAPDFFLLHWIESTAPGGGRELMQSIDAWARITSQSFCSCLCSVEVVGFYEKCGWRQLGEFGAEGFVAMGWQP